jgi:hypothetical protein
MEEQAVRRELEADTGQRCLLPSTKKLLSRKAFEGKLLYTEPTVRALDRERPGADLLRHEVPSA